MNVASIEESFERGVNIEFKETTTTTKCKSFKHNIQKGWRRVGSTHQEENKRKN